MMRIGILTHGFITWGGGIDFLRTICGSLRAVDKQVELHVLLPTKGPRLSIRRTAGSVLRSAKQVLGATKQVPGRPDVRIIRDLIESPSLNLITHEIDIGDSSIVTAARRLNLTSLLPVGRPMKFPPRLQWLGYIADFQHTHLPHLFAEADIANRNREFKKLLMSADSVIVNSKATAVDIKAFAPNHSSRIISLPFSAAPDPIWFDWNEPPLKKYEIDGPFFIISNQFWQHKDHLTAYRAFARIARTHPDVRLVCTGEPSDYRNLSHFNSLTQEADALGISGRLHVLGLIPKQDQIALLKASISVIQPTRFEGGPGGGAVYDAVALGVPAIVSDLPVNLEIEESTVTYFRTGDCDSLANKMIASLSSPPAVRIDSASLIELGIERRRRCGRVLLEELERVGHLGRFNG